MKKRIITISRENGSGGRYIGEKLAEALKIPCYGFTVALACSFPAMMKN